MEIKIEIGNITGLKCEAIVVNLFDGITNPAGATGAVDRALGGAITALIKDGEIKSSTFN